MILKLLQNKEKTNIKNWRGEKRRKFTRKEVSSGENEREIVVFAVGVSVIEICGSQQPAKIPLLKGGRERDRFINNIAIAQKELCFLCWRGKYRHSVRSAQQRKPFFVRLVSQKHYLCAYGRYQDRWIRFDWVKIAHYGTNKVGSRYVNVN